MRRQRRRLLLLLIGLLSVLTTAALSAFVRGTWADTERRVPGSIEEGPVCYVYQHPSGEKEVRCAIRLTAPLDEVWAAITDYEHFGDICSCVHADEIVYEPDGVCRLKARANSVPPGQMTFAVEMRQEQMLEKYVASWDQSGGSLRVNRGQWILTPEGPRQTLLEVGMEIQVDGVPTFILRNISRGRLLDVARAVDRRLRDDSRGEKW